MELLIASIPKRRGDPSSLYNPVHLHELEFSSTNLTHYLRSMLFGVPINGSQIVSVEPEDFMTNLEAVLNKTSPRTLANYIGWKMVDEFTKTINVHYTNAGPRWQRCVKVSGSTIQLLPDGVI